MWRLRACCRLRLLLSQPPPHPQCHPLARGPHGAAAAHCSTSYKRFSSASSSMAVAPHDARDSVLGGSAYYAWISAAAEPAPAPSAPQEEEDDGPERFIPVKAYFLSTRKHASGWLPETRKDDYAVVEKPSLSTWMKGGLDYIVLKSLDTDGIRIISSVLGQSIALDHYIWQVDDMVEEFTEINRVMEKTRDFTMQRKKPFQLVGRANSNLADVIIRLGLFDRSEIAWKNANYAQILEYLREEYELNQRFGSLDFKLKFVEHNIHFLQEVLQNRRSDLLEWGVIILLTIEIVISLYEIVKDSNMIS